MNRRNLPYWIGGAVILLIVTAYSSVFKVDERQQALVFQFQEHKRTIQNDPGLHFKIPFIQNVVYFDRRILDLNPAAEEVTLRDQKRVIVDTYVRYRIVDPLQYYRATLGSEVKARSLLSNIANSSTRQILGRARLPDLLSQERRRLMAEMKQASDDEAKKIGIVITDMRLRRADLPTQTREEIFNRIRAERAVDARTIRAQGELEKARIIAQADLDASLIVAEAQKTAASIMAEGDAQRAAILNQAYSAYPAFYDFYLSMDAMKKNLEGKSTTMIVSPEGNEFFRYFGSGTAAAPSAQGAR